VTLEDDTLQPTAAGQRNVVMLLSLFLLLLVFFIVLNAISSRDRKLARGTDGAGASQVEAPIDPAAVVGRGAGEGSGKSPSAVEAREQLEKSLVAAVEAWSDRVMIERRIEGERLELVFPVSGLFLPAEARYRGRRERFIAELGRALGKAPPGWRFEADVAVDGRPRSPVQVDIPGEIAIARAIALARTMRRTGAMPEAVSVGVTGTDDGSVRVRFAARRTAPAPAENPS
jgi:hypothetical protein